VIEQVPVVRNVAVVPLTVQTLVVVVVKLTVRPEVAVAASVSGIPIFCGPGLTKLIVCAMRTLTTAVLVAVAPAPFVTVRVYVVVSAGVTLTGVPLMTARLPGVITPVPLAKTPVRLAGTPTGTDAGFAVKLLIVGSEGKDPPLNELHPAKTVRKRLKRERRKKVAVTRFIASPVTEATRGRSVSQEPGRISSSLPNYPFPVFAGMSIPVPESESQG